MSENAFVERLLFGNNSGSFGYKKLVMCRHFIGHAFVIFTLGVVNRGSGSGVKKVVV